MLGRSTRTIQAVELCQLPLSEELAMRIGHETGVEVGWLLSGKADVAPPRGTSAFGLQRFAPGGFTRKDYEQHRSWLELEPDQKSETELKAKTGGLSMAEVKTLAKAATLRARKRADRELVASLKSLLESTATSANGDLARWKVRQSIKAIAEEFAKAK